MNSTIKTYLQEKIEFISNLLNNRGVFFMQNTQQTQFKFSPLSDYFKYANLIANQ